MLISPNPRSKASQESVTFPPMRDLSAPEAAATAKIDLNQHSFSQISRGSQGAEPPQAGQQARPVHRLANNFSAGAKPKVSWRAKRHALRASSGKIVGGRQRRCGCKVVAGEVSMHRSEQGAHFRGIETCGSVWTCPVCAVKITETRRGQIKELFQKHHDAGGIALMTTLTLPHSMFDACKPLLEAVRASWGSMKAGRAWTEGAKLWSGWMGDVRALEVLHGSNGWHPHLHVVWLLEPGSDCHTAKRFADWVFDRWAEIMEKKSDLVCSRKGFDWRIIDRGEEAEYLSKWGAAEELTRAHTKASQGSGSRTPWQILGDYHENGDLKDAALFKEYATTFHGKRQLTWSQKIRGIYGIGEVSDEEAAQDEPKETAEVALIEKSLWRDLCNCCAQGPILDALDMENPVKLLEIMGAFKRPVILLKDDGDRLIFTYQDIPVPGFRNLVSKPGFKTWFDHLFRKW